MTATTNITRLFKQITFCVKLRFYRRDNIRIIIIFIELNPERGVFVLGFSLLLDRSELKARIVSVWGY